MASENEIERKRGAVESRERVESLRERWPLAFPIARADVRPLAIGSHKVIADAMGWGVAFTLGVLAVWKGSPPYCESVLRDQRINLDGSPSGEEVDERAKDMATKQLAKSKAKKARAVLAGAEVKAAKPPPQAKTANELRAPRFHESQSADLGSGNGPQCKKADGTTKF
jgi:sRNA-binding protein